MTNKYHALVQSSRVWCWHSPECHNPSTLTYHLCVPLGRSLTNPVLILLQIVKKVELEAQRAKGPNEAKGGRRRRNPVEDLKREVAIMRTLRHKNIVSLQVIILSSVHFCLPCLPASHASEHSLLAIQLPCCCSRLSASALPSCLPATSYALLAVWSQQSLVSHLLCSLVAIVPYTLQTMALTFGAFVALLLFESFLVSHSACLLHLLVCHTVHLYMQLIRQDS